MNKINAMKATIYLVAFAFLLNVHPAMAKSLTIGEVYKSLNGKYVIEVVSINELEITRGAESTPVGYSIDDDKLRVVFGNSDTRRIKYFKIIAEGLREVKMGVYILYSRNMYNMGLLRKSVKAGDIAAVKSLLDKGVDVNSKTGKGGTALMKAAYEGRINIVKLLIANGADIDAKNKYGSTALMKAVDGDHRATVKLLVDQGSDVNARNNRSSTALKLAQKKGYKEIAHILKNGGAKE